MYGANLPGFTLVDMLERLRRDGLLPYRLAAVSPGRRRATAGGGVLFDESGDSLLAETRRSGLPLVERATLAERIADRLRILRRGRGGSPHPLFREHRRLGSRLRRHRGVAVAAERPGPPGRRRAVSPTRGLVFEFAARGVPVVHLLYVKGLARDNGLPFDPVPFPPVGEGACIASDQGPRLAGPMKRRSCVWLGAVIFAAGGLRRDPRPP